MASKKPLARWPRFTLEDVHRFGGLLVGSFVVGFLYNFGQAMLPELAYVLVVLVVRPQGLFGRAAA